MIIKKERVTNAIVMFFFLTFLYAYWHPAKKNLRVGCAHSLSIQRRASNKLKEKRRNCCLFLSLSLPSFLRGPCYSSLSRNDYCLYLRYHKPCLTRPPARKTGREQMAQQYLCVRVAIMDNKSLATILWRSPLSFSRVSQPTNIDIYIHTSIIAYRAVRFRWHCILVMHVLVLL